ncbi:DnaB-like helicase C-terminal domain-containing protein [Aestuariivirga sp. YIM B02566]|uniref:Toprim domain-containing protein n=1 Tax=Taklimakanibacter albus TaxID=2800327 RepID=A0ACC5RGM6_9HYPH|nr:DnaB-like helicase C-terminal domain-containing protein [Aestuariivirga sp. YIM B02566]MBK1871553.1 toprim domain-containing protein [Aestuariivirga sp. YIM B02566]
MSAIKAPCPQCGSPDNLKIYDDGHEHCWSAGCAYHKASPHGADDERLELSTLPRRADLIPTGSFEDLPKRKLKAETLRRYGYFLHKDAGEIVHVAPYYSQDGELCVQKIRKADKTFPTIGGSTTPCKLFGQQVFGERFDKRLVVTTGEIDAMSVAQVMNFKCASVSVGGGDGAAAKHLKANYRWVDRFSEIVLFFDNDESGQKAATECAQLFQVGKVKLAKVNETRKDASGCLQANKPGEIEEAIYSAETWKPKGIVNAADCLEDVTADEVALRGYDWPWAGLNAATMGIQDATVIYLLAGAGVGKTTGLFHIEYTLLKQGVVIGHLGFEDVRADVMLGIMSVHASKRLTITPTPKEERAALHKELFSSGKFWMFDPETAEWGMKAIIGYIYYLVKALGCRLVVVDPLSFIIAGMEDRDERRAIDWVTMVLAKASKELSVPIVISHHLTRPEGTSHEEGGQISLKQARGSNSIGQFANVVIGMERNQQAEDPQAANDVVIRILKNRRQGKTGIATTLRFDEATGRLNEIASGGTTFGPAEY